MTTLVDRRAPTAADEDGWLRVEIPMPVFESGADQGKPVGWLSLNKLPNTVREQIKQKKIAKLWRQAAYNAYLKHRVPTGLDRIYVQIEYRFAENHGQEPSNFERTVKPIIDALQPMRRYHRKTRKGLRLVIELGAGVIPTDAQRHLVRGHELLVGEPLGKTNRVQGMVILYIKPFVETT